MLAGMFAFPGMTQLDLTGPHEVLSQLPGVEVMVVAETAEPLTARGGLRLVPDTTLMEAPQFDLFLLPGGPGIGRLLEHHGILKSLRRQARGADHVASVCTGSLLLGAAGLLKGRKATTHWASLDLLPIFGALPVTGRFVEDANIMTGGGVTAGIDFALTLAARLFGEEEAKKIQLALEYDPDPPYACGSPGCADPALVAAVRLSYASLHEERRRSALRAARFVFED